MMFAGNYVFIHYLGEDGSGCFQYCLLFLPIIFMVYNAIGQSAQPILSHNFEAGDTMRVRSAFRLALGTARPVDLQVFCVNSFVQSIIRLWLCLLIVLGPAYDIAVWRLPFVSGLVLFFLQTLLLLAISLKCRAGTPGCDDYSFAWVCFMVLFVYLACRCWLEGARDMAGGSWRKYYFL